MNPPSPSEVLAARKAAGLTQQAAAEAVGQASSSNWRAYESGRIGMHPSSWELFLLKTHQHPQWALSPRP